MIQKPILFSWEMVQALLAERKTMTRRMAGLNAINENPDDWDCEQMLIDVDDETIFIFCSKSGKPTETILPKYQIGDLMYVREEYYQMGHWELRDNPKRKSGKEYFYVPESDEIRFNDNPPFGWLKSHNRLKNKSLPSWYKRNSLFMPKSAARIWLQCTVELLSKS